MTLVKLAFLLSLTVALSRQILAGILMLIMTIFFTSPFGTHQLGLTDTAIFFGLSFAMGMTVTWITVLPVYMMRIRGVLNDPALSVLLSVIIALWVAVCLVLTQQGLGLPLDLTVPSVFLRTFPVVLLIFWLGMANAQFPVQNLLKRNLAGQQLVARLSADKQGRLLSLTAQDHYVEVVTTAGTELIRMRLADALKSVESDLGMQIHRSHWVAYDAIERVDEQARQVILKDGRSFSVSASYLPSLVLATSKAQSSSNAMILSDVRSTNSAVLKVRAQHEKAVHALEILFLEAFRSNSRMSLKAAFKIARLSETLRLASPVFTMLALSSMVAVAFFGSYGLYDQPLWMQPVYWLATSIVLTFTVQPMHRLCYVAGLLSNAPAWTVSLLISLTETTLAIAVMYGASLLMFGENSADLSLFVLGVVATNIAMNLTNHFSVGEFRSIKAWQSRITYPPIVLDLPFELRASLVALSAKGRHVEVKTEAGTAQLRIRFKDALDRVGQVKGVQIHRSHWVAESQIERRLIKDAKNFIELKDGTELPLAEARLEQVDAVLNN